MTKILYLTLIYFVNISHQVLHAEKGSTKELDEKCDKPLLEEASKIQNASPIEISKFLNENAFVILCSKKFKFNENHPNIMSEMEFPLILGKFCQNLVKGFTIFEAYNGLGKHIYQTFDELMKNPNIKNHIREAKDRNQLGKMEENSMDWIYLKFDEFMEHMKASNIEKSAHLQPAPARNILHISDASHRRRKRAEDPDIDPESLTIRPNPEQLNPAQGLPTTRPQPYENGPLYHQQPYEHTELHRYNPQYVQNRMPPYPQNNLSRNNPNNSPILTTNLAQQLSNTAYRPIENSGFTGAIHIPYPTNGPDTTVSSNTSNNLPWYSNNYLQGAQPYNTHHHIPWRPVSNPSRMTPSNVPQYSQNSGIPYPSNTVQGSTLNTSSPMTPSHVSANSPNTVSPNTVASSPSVTFNVPTIPYPSNRMQNTVQRLTPDNHTLPPSELRRRNIPSQTTVFTPTNNVTGNENRPSSSRGHPNFEPVRFTNFEPILPPSLRRPTVVADTVPESTQSPPTVSSSLAGITQYLRANALHSITATLFPALPASPSLDPRAAEANDGQNNAIDDDVCAALATVTAMLLITAIFMPWTIKATCAYVLITAVLLVFFNKQCTWLKVAKGGWYFLNAVAHEYNNNNNNHLEQED